MEFNINNGLWRALFETIILVVIGFFFRKSGFFKKDTVQDLTRLILYLCLPALILYSFLTHFKADTIKDCSFLLLASFVIFLLGFFLGFVIYKIFIKRESHKREFILLNAFQNSGYLPLALVANIFLGSEKELVYLYIFSYLVGFNLIMLSFGFFYMKKGSDFSIKDFLSVPFLASLLGILLAFMGLGDKIPLLIMHPLSKLGETTIPLSMILLGMMLGESKLFEINNLKEILVLVFCKLIFLPLIVISILRLFKLPPVLSFLLFLEAAMPSATTLSIIAHCKNANTEFVSQGIIYTHLFLIFTLPILFWVY